VTDGRRREGEFFRRLADAAQARDDLERQDGLEGRQGHRNLLLHLRVQHEKISKQVESYLLAGLDAHA
jgi:hypothetical protein